MTTIEERCEEWDRETRDRKAALPRRDLAPLLVIWHDGDRHLLTAERDEVRSLCEAMRDQMAGPIEAVLYSADALRRQFSGDSHGLADHEVLATVGVDPEGNLASIVTPYHYEADRVVFEPSEAHQLLDQSVVEDLRRAFR